MDPSSLIFVVILGIWAVYLLGHWVRRRDMLATARSIDRFSEAMRVLERRPPQPVSSSRSGSYVVAPTRLHLDVAAAAAGARHARPAGWTTGAAVPDEAAAPAGAGGEARASAPGGEAARRQRVLRGAAAGADPGTASARRHPGPMSPAPVRRSGPTPPRQDSAARRARAVVLCALVLLVPLSVLAVAVTPLPAWLPVVLAVALAVQVVRLRRAAVRERAAARRERPTAGSGVDGPEAARPAAGAQPVVAGSAPRRAPRGAGLGRASHGGQGGAGAGTRRQGVGGSDSSRGDEPRSRPVDGVGGSVRPGGRDEGERSTADGPPPQSDGPAATGGSPEGLQAPAAAGLSDGSGDAPQPAASAAETPAQARAEGAGAGKGWWPVPVPPPTYTLKPKAPPVRRPVPRPADGRLDDAVGQSRGGGEAAAPTPAAGSGADATADGFDLDAILERRIASGG